MFTVILLKPDYLADEYGKEICRFDSAASNTPTAEEEARQWAAKETGTPADDWHVLLIIGGDDYDLLI